MTKLEFQPIFKRLLKDYGVEKKMNVGQIESFFDYLRHHDKEDFMSAARRIPALEVSTAYKPFPTAECMQKYILDAQETRGHREKHTAPRSLEEIHRRGSGGITDSSPGGRAWAGLMMIMIRRGTGNYRKKLAAQFVHDHSEWLGKNASFMENLQEFMQTDYGYEEFGEYSVTHANV